MVPNRPLYFSPLWTSLIKRPFLTNPSHLPIAVEDARKQQHEEANVVFSLMVLDFLGRNQNEQLACRMLFLFPSISLSLSRPLSLSLSTVVCFDDRMDVTAQSAHVCTFFFSPAARRGGASMQGRLGARLFQPDGMGSQKNGVEDI